MPNLEFKCNKCNKIFEKLLNTYIKTVECISKDCDGTATSGFWSGRGPSFKMSKIGKTKIDHTRMDGGVPMGEMKGDEDYEWMRDPESKKGGPTP